MKKLLILSGKGGTGKTTIASSFIKLSNAKAYADCDVDAPNLHLALRQDVEPKIKDYYGMPQAYIDLDKCIGCNLCRENCRFDAIYIDEKEYKVDEFACEGCGVCQELCSVNAITLVPKVDGELRLYQSESTFSTAELKMGSGTSGMLVTEVKKQLNFASKEAKLAIIDGSPGIGCPVIASISGVDMVLIITEPTVSGISDMKRIIDTAERFQTRIAICINKFDVNTRNSNIIEKFCKDYGYSFVGKIPYDSNVIKTINEGNLIVDIDSKASKDIKDVYNNTIKILYKKENVNE